jgi:hypothetical protein
VYKLDESTHFSFIVDNKILRNIHVEVNAKRESNEAHANDEYKVEALVDTYVGEHRFYRVYADALPEGKSINAHLTVERKDNTTNYEKVSQFESLLTLKHSGDSSLEIDHAIDLQFKTPTTQHEVRLFGHIGGGMLKSNLDISIQFTNNTFTFPINVVLAHYFADNVDTFSYVQVGAKLPNTTIDHLTKVLFKADIRKKQLNHIEFQFFKPQNADTPHSFFISASNNTETGVSEFETGNYLYFLLVILYSYLPASP